MYAKEILREHISSLADEESCSIVSSRVFSVNMRERSLTEEYMRICKKNLRKFKSILLVFSIIVFYNNFEAMTKEDDRC